MFKQKQIFSKLIMINPECTPIFKEIEDINFNVPWLKHIPSSLRNKLNYSQNHKYLSDCFNYILYNLYPNGLMTGKSEPLVFVPQQELDEINKHTPTAYETFVAETGKIPTRNNLHDLFNAWVWLTFPKTKAILNRYQTVEIARDGITNARGKVRDAITIFDECGAVFVTSNANISTALKNFDWQNSLVKTRNEWDNPHDTNSAKKTSTAVYIFGHATLEQLVEARKPICSHCKIILVEEDFFKLNMSERMTYLDSRLIIELTEWLETREIKPRDLSPLPILGIPHFWDENKNVEFYNDPFVFRNGRRKK